MRIRPLHWRLLVAVLSCVLSACDEAPAAPTGPSTPSISPPTTELKVADKVTFTLQNAPSSTTVVWSSSDTSTVSVDSSGTVTALRPGGATLTARAGDQSVSRQLQIFENFSGTWSGQAVITTCFFRRGSGPTPCRFILGSPEPLSLQLTQNGSVLSGNMSIYNFPAASGSVSGRVSQDGHETISGVLTSSELTLQIVSWNATIAADKTLAGTFSDSEQFTNAFGQQVLEIGFTFNTVTRVMEP